MNVPFAVIITFSAFLFTVANCDHDHNSHHSKILWQTILTSLGIDWQNHTVSLTTETINTGLQSKPDHHHSEYSDFESTSITQFIGNGGPFDDNVDNAVKASLGLIIGVPIAVIVILCICCFLCCKFCCDCCRQKDHIIVMNNAPMPAMAPPPAQVVINQQQPPPRYEMQGSTGWNPPHPQQQWNAIQQQPPQYEPNAHTNPNFSPPYNPDYSSAPKY